MTLGALSILKVDYGKHYRKKVLGGSKTSDIRVYCGYFFSLSRNLILNGTNVMKAYAQTILEF